MKLKALLQQGFLTFQSHSRVSVAPSHRESKHPLRKGYGSKNTINMRNLILPLLPVLLFLSCSTPNDDEGVLPPTDREELEEAIVGKWDVESPNEETNAINKQAGNRCNIFTLIFNSDGSFIIDHQDGVTTGTYTVVSASSISLGSAGSLGNVSFVGTSLVFFIELNGVCSMAAQSIRDVDYVFGDCHSFLNCNMGTFWKSTTEESTTFLYFENYSHYFNRWEYFETGTCEESLNNQDATYVLFQNQKNEIKFIREKEGSRSIFTYRTGQEEGLEEEIETGGEVFTRTYLPASMSDMDEFSGYWVCGQRTYVPDDFFEGWLIHFGYDDIMDDYVLTENINTIEQFYISDYNNSLNGITLQSLQGLENFTALKDLEVQASNLPAIDLSGNRNLERLFLGSPALTSLDLSKNVKLNSLYFEFANIHTLDLSKNTELRSVELQLMPLPLLDISNNPKLEMLTIEGGGFKELIGIENPILWHLNLSSSEVEQVNVQLFPNLKELILHDNHLTTLDVSNLSSLESLEVQENRLNVLNVSKNLNLYHFWASQNPNLECIQIAQVHLDRMEEGNSRMWWEKDETSSYSLNCN